MKNILNVTLDETVISLFTRNSKKLEGSVVFMPNSKRTRQKGKKLGDTRFILKSDNEISALFQDLVLGNIAEMQFNNYSHLAFYPDRIAISFDSIPDLIDKFQIFTETQETMSIPTAKINWCETIDRDFYLTLSDAEKVLLLSVDALRQISENSEDLYPRDEHLHILDDEIDGGEILAQHYDGRFYKPLTRSLKDLIGEIRQEELRVVRYSVGCKIVSIDFDGIWKFDIGNLPKMNPV